MSRGEQLKWASELVDRLDPLVLWSMMLTNLDNAPTVTIFVNNDREEQEVIKSLGWLYMAPDEFGKKFKTWFRPEATVSVVYRTFYMTPVEREDMNG